MCEEACPSHCIWTSLPDCEQCVSTLTQKRVHCLRSARGYRLGNTTRAISPTSLPLSNVNVPPCRLTTSFCNGQPESGTTGFPITGLFESKERLQHPFEISFRDAGPAIDDVDLHLLIAIDQLNMRFASIANRIGDQIGQATFQRQGLRKHRRDRPVNGDLLPTLHRVFRDGIHERVDVN